MIPLFSSDENKLFSLKGSVSAFYRLGPPDLEQLSDLELQSLYQRFEAELKGLPIGKFLKFYFLDGKAYLNAPEGVSFESFSLLPQERPVETFLGGEVISNFEFYEDYLNYNGEFVRLISLKRPPLEVSFNELYELSFGLADFTIHLERIAPAKAKQGLNLKRKMNFTSLFKSMKDIESVKAYGESEELLERLMEGSISLFKTECFFIQKASTKNELDEKLKLLMERLSFVDSLALIEGRALPFFYRSLIPGVNPSFDRVIELPSDYLSYLVPFHEDQIHETGINLTSIKGNNVKFDLFEESSHNFNLLVTGSSGQGKSMMANKILLEQIKGKAKGVCLDLGNSFKKNALYHKGVIFSERFNPMQFRCPRYLKEFILACVEEEMNKRDQGRLFEAVCDALIAEVATFDKLLDYLEKDFRGISSYFAEIRSYFSDDLVQLRDFTYCDFSDYPEAIKAPLIIYLIEYFKNLEGRKLFVFDECWHLLSKNADYIAECFRTFRKHEASAIAISQNLDDFSQTQLGRVIIQNTHFKFFFRQSLGVSEFVDSDLAQRVQALQSVKGSYSEFLILSEALRKPTRFYPTPIEYELFTSDKRDQRAFENYLKLGSEVLGFKRAIVNFTKLKYPDWRHDEVYL